MARCLLWLVHARQTLCLHLVLYSFGHTHRDTPFVVSHLNLNSIGVGIVYASACTISSTRARHSLRVLYGPKLSVASMHVFGVTAPIAQANTIAVNITRFPQSSLQPSLHPLRVSM